MRPIEAYGEDGSFLPTRSAPTGFVPRLDARARPSRDPSMKGVLMLRRTVPYPFVPGEGRRSSAIEHHDAGRTECEGCSQPTSVEDAAGYDDRYGSDRMGDLWDEHDRGKVAAVAAASPPCATITSAPRAAAWLAWPTVVT